ncbi:TlpA family protein disulfide reductase [Halorientalis salina]|uniref:TlpA family protein disulfide reductase n=1 Tax=Halorientalis salina TaxID=2932266 RepID=UPI0010AB66BA|nr:TlpA disulfide reductase family protein [Halorientalis salina]
MYDRGRRGFLAMGTTAVATLAGCSGILGGGDENEQRGTPRSSFTLQTLDVGGSTGSEIRVQPPGEVALIDFFASWYEPCKPQMAELRTVRENNPDLHMLSITWETERRPVRTFWERYDGTWPVAMDPQMKAGTKYNVEGLPTVLVVDAEGQTAWRHTGLTKAETIEANLATARQ